MARVSQAGPGSKIGDPEINELFAKALKAGDALIETRNAFLSDFWRYSFEGRSAALRHEVDAFTEALIAVCGEELTIACRDAAELLKRYEAMDPSTLVPEEFWWSARAIWERIDEAAEERRLSSSAISVCSVLPLLLVFPPEAFCERAITVRHDEYRSESCSERFYQALNSPRARCDAPEPEESKTAS